MSQYASILPVIGYVTAHSAFHKLLAAGVCSHGLLRLHRSPLPASYLSYALNLLLCLKASCSFLNQHMPNYDCAMVLHRRQRPCNLDIGSRKYSNYRL